MWILDDPRAATKRARREQAHGTPGRTLAIVALAAALGACGGSSHLPPPPSAPSPLIGKPVPEFRRTAIDGTTITTAELRGKVVVLEFFAEYCIPCRVALPAAASAQRERPEAFFLGVSEDDGPDTALRMATNHGVTFKVVHDQGRVLAGRMRVADLPVTVIIDRAGTVRWVGTKASTADELTRVIDDVGRVAN